MAQAGSLTPVLPLAAWAPSQIFSASLPHLLVAAKTYRATDPVSLNSEQPQLQSVDMHMLSMPAHAVG